MAVGSRTVLTKITTVYPGLQGVVTAAPCPGPATAWSSWATRRSAKPLERRSDLYAPTPRHLPDQDGSGMMTTITAARRYSELHSGFQLVPRSRPRTRLVAHPRPGGPGKQTTARGRGVRPAALLISWGVDTILDIAAVLGVDKDVVQTAVAGHSPPRPSTTAWFAGRADDQPHRHRCHSGD